MKEKVISILKNSSNKKLDPIEIIKHIKKNYTSDDIKNILDCLYDLVNEGIVISCKKNTFKLATDEYLKAKIEVVSSGNAWALLENEDDIFIDKRNLIDAKDGDVCLLETFKKNGSIEAKVKRVLERNLPLGEIVIEKNVTYVKPLKDYKLNIVLLENENISLVDGEIVKLKSVKEDKDNIYVIVDKKIGHKNSPDIDTLKVMAELEVPAGFSEETEIEVRTLPRKVEKKDYEGREDLTKEIIFTIDGIDTKDIDDAVGLKILDNNNYLLTVSIADVTNYVKFGSSTFKDAYNKGNSTYMADKVEPMLPIELSNGICSLNPQEERCAITTEIEFDKNGNVVNKRMFPSIIKSRKKMNYDDVNKVLDGKNVEEYEEYKDILLKMNELSTILKNKRVEEGEIEFASDEIKLIVDENGKVTDIKKHVQYKGETLIEEFMIASNEASIDLLTKETDYAVYRVHAKPSPKKIEEFIKFMGLLGYQIKGKFEYSDMSNKNIQSILKVINGTKDERVLNQKLLRSMQKAVYSPVNIGHYGLASKKYTHETSPIRRFSDLLLHYLIKIALFNMDMGVSLEEIGRGLPEACEHISMTERRSDEAEYEVNDMKIAEYMENYIGEEYDAVISGILKHGFFVETCNYVEGFVALETIKGFYTVSDDMLYYLDRKKRVCFRLGDKVRVKCINANKETRRVDFSLVEGTYGNRK